MLMDAARFHKIYAVYRRADRVYVVPITVLCL